MYCNNYICGKKLRFIIDLRVSINIISKTAFRELKITDQPKENLYELIAADGLKIFRQKTVDKKIKLLLV